MKENFEKLLKINELYRTLIFFGIWLLVGIIIYFLIIKPQQDTIEKKNAEYIRLKQKTSQLIRIQRDFEKLKKKYEEVKKKYQIVIKKLPDSREIPELLLKISSYGKKNNLNFLLFKPNREIEKNFYAVIPISLKFTGSFKNTGMFFYELGNNTRIVKIKNFVVNKKRKLIYISGTLETYKFIKKSNEKKKKTKKRKK